MKFIFWIITSILAVFLNYVGLAYLNYNFVNISVWFIIPVGAFGLGSVASLGYMLWYKIFPTRNTQNKKIHIILSSLIIFLGFVGIHYLIYFSTYIDSSNSINYAFKGSHISEFVLPNSHEPINFINYTKFSITNSSRTLNLKSINKEIELGSNSTSNWIHFVLSFLGYIGGTLTIINEVKENLNKKVHAKSEQATIQ